MNSGIYLIECGDKKYVGQARNLKGRWTNHKSALRRNNHGNPHMQNLWNKYGEKKFYFTIIEYCSIDNLNDREIYWINKLNTVSPNGLNFRMGGGARSTFSEESKQRMSDAHKGTGIGIENPFFGKTHTEETKDKISKANTGKVRSDEIKKKISLQQKGKIVSDETKKKMSNSLMGNTRNLGKSFSENHKRKMSDARKRWWNKKKGIL